MKNTKRGLCVLLGFVFLFTSVGIGLDGADRGKMDVPETNSLSSAEVSFACTFYVPELIYLTPSIAANSALTFKYYVDCDTNGNLNTLNAKTSGFVYFHCPTASSVYITCSGASVTLDSTSGFNTINTTVTAGTLNTGLSQGYTSTITWTATYIVNGESKTAKAYTVCYAPQVSVVASAIRTYNDDGTSGYNADFQGWAYISGVHGCGAGGNYQANTSGPYQLNPMQGDVYSTDGDVPSATWFYPLTDGWTKYANWQGGDDRITVQAVSPTGTLTVDTSRYSNINQIPNLKCGFAMTDMKGMVDSYLRYASNFSDTVSGWHYGDFTSSSNTVQNEVIQDVEFPVIFWGSTDVGQPRLRGVCYGTGFGGEMWSQDVSDCDLIRLKWAGWARNSDEYNAISCLVVVNMTKVDKSALRSKVRLYTNMGLQASDYENFAAFESALQDAAKRLGNPTSTDASYSALDTAYGNLTRVSYSAKTYHRSADGNVYGDESQTFFSGQTVSFGPNSYIGYYVSSASGFTTSTSPQTVFNQKANITQTYNYTPYTYTVTFDAQGGSVSPGYSSVTYNSTYGAGTGGWPTPTRTGYTFEGWYTGVGGSGTNITSGTKVTGNPAQILYAKWSINTYNVCFDAKGGTGGWSAPMTYGSAITAPTVAKEGHMFIEWYPHVPSAVPAYNVTYEAVWAVLSYRITFNANGGTGGTVNTMSYGSVLTPPSVTKPGYVLAGWLPELPATVPAADTEYVAQWVADGSVIVFDANGGTGGGSFILKAGEPMTPPAVSRPGYTFAGWSPAVPSVVPAEDTTYTAQWSINSYTISFDANGGTESTSGYMVYGTPLTAPVVSRAGYTFAGWSPAVPATVPAQNMTYTAQWNVNSYIITFDANGGTGSKSQPMNYGVSLTAPVVTREGYTLAGWSPQLPATVPAQNTTYTAQWTINNYLITFDAGGGTGGTSETMDYGEALTAPDVTREGYTFAGWSPEVPATVPAQNATYTAQWTVNSYLITFDANGGAGGTSAAMDYGEPLAPPAVTKDGYTFAGWSPEVPATVPAADTVYTAQWSLNTATVQFDLNGGAGTVPESQTGEPGAAVTLPAQGDIAREYYNFLGWAQQPDATVPLVSFIIPEAGATLYAVWTRIPVELVKADGSTTVINNGEKLIFGLEEGLTKNGFAANFVRVNGDATLRYTYVSDSFGTGTVVELVDNVTGEVVETYTVIIFGDVDGDGFITVADENIIDMVSSYQLELENAAFLFAADLTQDGFVDAFDLNILSAATSYTATIDQTNPSGV